MRASRQDRLVGRLGSPATCEMLFDNRIGIVKGKIVCRSFLLRFTISKRERRGCHAVGKGPRQMRPSY